TMINQLKAVVGFKEDEPEAPVQSSSKDASSSVNRSEVDPEVLKTRVEGLDLSARTANALAGANIRTVGGLARKKEKDLLEIEGLGSKGLTEIKEILSTFGITLK